MTLTQQAPDATATDMATVERLAARFGKYRERWQAWLQQHPVLRFIYRTLLITVATAVIIAGILMLVLPGPGWLTIFLGLAILGSEFAWARRLLAWLRLQLNAMLYRWKQYRAQRRAAKQRPAAK
ncbi:TIGR02611 family protein [Canibacter oris]|uniref:Uncharacterized protein (TIGR02611 family) n=1 Tax=Canibacter oris TaxID=1365628 RepID=A0A840DIY6_9MICO|nr:TIGR02611 family protein [Canibacter oris]MBB4071442.1 uncharacterized protein (TIGR02611 family) [Canibacter oris]